MKPGACPMLPFCSRRSTAGVGPLGLHRDRGTIYQQLATARMDTSGGARKGGRADSPSMKSFDFEVFGKVQGVFFRKYTEAKAKELKLVGWVLNTSQGTVKGQAQGSPAAIERMKQWLANEGSPKSRIANAVFENERDVDKVDFAAFAIRR